MKILGVDPGTVRTGWGILEDVGAGGVRALGCGTIKTIPSLSSALKLKEIYSGLTKVIDKFRPELAAIESIFFSRNVRSALKIGEARSVAMLLCALKSIPVEEYLPARIKQSVVGNGRASKQQVQFMVSSLLKLSQSPAEDASDALAVALCCWHNKSQVTRAQVTSKKFKS